MSLEIRQLPWGKGVIAASPIASRSHILRFTGPLLHYRDTTPHTYALQIGPDLYLGASGSFDDYINHSCNPNAGLVIRGLEVDLIAIRDIAPGEEICFDYSTSTDEDDFEFDCFCGQPNCRGRIRDGKHLPEDVFQRYAQLGIIPEHVLKHRR
jgi:SET domain-containing protein